MSVGRLSIVRMRVSIILPGYSSFIRLLCVDVILLCALCLRNSIVCVFLHYISILD